MLRFPLFLVFTFCLSVSVGAQQAPAVSGTIRAASGVIPGVSVNVVVADSVIETVTTGPDGQYRVRVPAGTPFTLVARYPGFADEVVTFAGIEGTVMRDLQLHIGHVAVVVTATRSPQNQARVTQAVKVATA